MKLYRIVYAIFIASGHGHKWHGLKSTWEIWYLYIYNACGGITACYKQQLTNMLKVTLIQ